MTSSSDAVRVHRLGPIVAVAAMLLAPPAAAQAQRPATAGGADLPPQALAQIEALQREKASRSPLHRKIDSQLLSELKMWRGEPIADGIWTMATNVPYVSDTGVALDVQATVTSGLLDNLRRLGAQIGEVSATYRTIRVVADLDRVELLAGLDGVTFIAPAADRTTQHFDADVRPRHADAARLRARVAAAMQSMSGGQMDVTTGAGSVTSQGDATHGAAIVRSTRLVDGTGVKVGVLSDGVSHLADSQARGDLGAVTVLAGQAGSGDEGTAMLEIVHDLAPGAQLYFATAFSGKVSFANNIRALRAAGCDIIVDDVEWTGESPFQDGQAPGVNSPSSGGVIAQAVKDVTAAGALYFSAATNSGNLSSYGWSGTWEGDFVDGGAITTWPLCKAGTGCRIHSFGGQTYDVLTYPTTGLGIELFWADPLGAATTDYDLYVLDPSGTVIQGSYNYQSGSGDPYERIPGSWGSNYRIVVVLFSGSPKFLHLGTNRGSLSIATSGAIGRHAATTADGSYGVAATPAIAPGPYPGEFNSGNSFEPFSSDGPRRIFFRADGSAFTPGNSTSTGGIVLQKPDLTAADGVSVTGVGGFPTTFYGTSAAAPHAAAIAALMKSWMGSLNAALIRFALTKGAVDIWSPGWDRNSGAGIAMADRGFASLAHVTGLTPDQPSPQAVGATVTWTAATSDGIAPIQYKWWVYDGSTWQPARDWTTSNTFAWTPAAPNANYTVGVWVRSSGDTSDAPESYATGTFSIQANPITAATVSADQTSPQTVGTTITFTAGATGGYAPLQYKWWIYDGVTWSVLRNWGTSTTFAWTPGAANANYVVGVWVRSNANALDAPEMYATMPFAIAAATAPPVSVTLGAGASPPQQAGTTIAFTASAGGGIAPLQYKWWLWDGAAWSVLRDWGTSSTFAWTPATPNDNYAVRVWVRSSGDTSDAAEASAQMAFAIQAPASIAASLAADMTAPQPAGTTITFTASASGGIAPLQYKWWIFDGATWSVLRNWGPSTTFAWTPGAANANYIVGVWVRSNGNGTDAPEVYATVPFAIDPASSPGAPTVTIAADKPAPQPVGTTITWTATATGAAPLQYKWWIFDGVTWSVLRDWSTDNTLAWTPTAINANDIVGVWLRTGGSTIDAPEVYATAPFAIQPQVTLSADKTPPQLASTTVTWTATAAGVVAPAQYKWWIFDGVNWTVARDWGTSNTFAWTPGSANSGYLVGVWIRGASSAVDAPEAYASSPFAIGSSSVISPP